MDKSFKILLLLLHLGVASLQSQGLLQMGHQIVYEYNIYEIGLPDPWVSQSIETITVGGDTLINNLMYSKIITTLPPPCGIFDTLEFLRAEGNKIFRLSRDRQQEFLMIDFDESVGYELLYEESEGDVDTGYVTIDSFGVEILADGTTMDVQYMRIFNNQSFDDDAVYKVYRDIGFVQYGLLFPNLGTGLCDIYEGVQIRCSVNNLDTIHFTPYDCYELSFPNGVLDIDYLSLDLFPNPTSGEVILPDGFTLLDISNLNGQIFVPDQSGNGIDISTFAPGLYFFRLAGLNGTSIYLSRMLKL